MASASVGQISGELPFQRGHGLVLRRLAAALTAMLAHRGYDQDQVPVLGPCSSALMRPTLSE